MSGSGREGVNGEERERICFLSFTFLLGFPRKTALGFAGDCFPSAMGFLWQYSVDFSTGPIEVSGVFDMTSSTRSHEGEDGNAFFFGFLAYLGGSF